MMEEFTSDDRTFNYPVNKDKSNFLREHADTAILKPTLCSEELLTHPETSEAISVSEDDAKFDYEEPGKNCFVLVVDEHTENVQQHNENLLVREQDTTHFQQHDEKVINTNNDSIKKCNSNKKKKAKKKRKNCKQKPFNEAAGESGNPSKQWAASEQTPDKKATEQNVVPVVTGRPCRPNKRIGGDDSDSDKEAAGKRLPSHYAGLHDSPDSSKESSMEIETDQSTVVPRTTEKDTHLLTDADACVIQWNRLIKNLTLHERKNLREIMDMTVHCGYKRDCSGNVSEPNFCREYERCSRVNRFLNHTCCQGKTCRQCKVIEASYFIHAAKCTDSYCPVEKCPGFKRNMMLKKKYRQAMRMVSSCVLHSISPLLKEGHSYNQDVDYTFLYKKKLGSGTFGNVYSVWFYDLIKDVEASIIVKETKYDLKNEARIHKRIREDHPNILGPIAMIALSHDGSKDSVKGYVLMKKAECSLYEFRKSHTNGCLPMDVSIYFIAQLYDGLAFLHSKNIVHKDIKDSNILMFENGQRVMIADWDAAETLGSEMTGTPKGTKGYAAPEVYLRKPHAAPADVYSLAVTFLMLVFGDRSLKLTDKIALLYKEHRGMAELISRCLKTDPTERPTAKEMCASPFLKLDPHYKVNVPEGVQLLREEVGSVHFVDDLGGKHGDAAREKAERIQDESEEKILAQMDHLPNKLPTENIPTTSEWNYIAQPTGPETEEMDCE